jgi:hypothetical protein
MNIRDMSLELYLIQSSQCMSKESRQAAKRAGELLRAFRSALDLDWNTNAADLHSLACDVQPVTHPAPAP